MFGALVPAVPMLAAVPNLAVVVASRPAAADPNLVVVVASPLVAGVGLRPM